VEVFFPYKTGGTKGSGRLISEEIPLASPLVLGHSPLWDIFQTAGKFALNIDYEILKSKNCTY